MSREEQYENLSIAELEAMAIKQHFQQEKDKSLIHEILEIRKDKLNENFVFTPKHIEKFLWIDQEIKRCVNELQRQGEKIIKDVQKLMNKKNAFFNDYEIKAVMKPCILDEEGIGVEDEIIDLIDDFQGNRLLYSFLYFDPRSPHKECNPYLDNLNWNGNSFIGAGSTFADYHIGFGMHELYDHSLWSYPDIMRISQIDCNICVEYQRY